MTPTIQCTQYLSVNYDIIYEQEEDGNNNDQNKPQGTTPVGWEPPLKLSDLLLAWEGSSPSLPV